MRPAAAARKLHWLPLAALFTATAVNAHHLAWWCLPLLVVATGWHLRSALYGLRQPGRLARLGFAILATLGVLLSFRTLNGVAAGATLLAAMTAAKLFEARARRDWYVICGATLFLLLAACLDRQQLWRLPLYALCLWLCAAALRDLSGGTPLPAGTLLRESGRQLLYALPLALLCFLFFPRLSGAFWAVPRDDTAISGLGEELNPGRIARLVESDQPALRARFDGPPPPPAQRYWRALVLHDFDGYTWRRHHTGRAPPGALIFRGARYDYTETLEPNTIGAIVALEMSRPPQDPAIAQSADFQLLTPRPVREARSYELSGYPQAATAGELAPAMRELDLALPEGLNPRARELALRLRAQAADDAAFVANAMAWLRDGGYTYTLTPQRLGHNSVDALLFDTREGFCGHYASAFVSLMRAGGVPSRVVAGYQGGEWNPIGRYLLVRQSHAHAWAEVWLPDRGWTRADPTAVISPGRINRDLLQFGDGLGYGASPLLGTADWLAPLLQGWDALNAWWQDRVVGFDLRKQLALAGRLGFGDRGWQTLATALAAGLALWLAWLAWSIRGLARAGRPDALARAWRRIDRRLARAGHARAVHEGVLDYCARLAASAPAAAASLAPLARCYVRLRYGPPPAAQELREFLREARAYRLN